MAFDEIGLRWNWISFIVPLCVCLSLFISEFDCFPKEVGTRLPKSFDFIIVGGGTAGCAVANRLSENGKYSVLLLEAGGVPPEFMSVPAFAQTTDMMPELTFQYHSVPQRHAALGLDGGIVRIPLGRVLGGTSQINHNMFNRGSPLDYDRWANITGDRSWAYANMLPFFKKSETYMGEFSSSIHHGSDGPITVSVQRYAPNREAFFAAGQEAGLTFRDPNGPQQTHSVTPLEMNRRFGRRVSSYRGYIEPIMNSRGNLKIITNAYVTKVHFDGKTAVGVEYIQNGTQPHYGNVALANQEVILSAGTFGSATLLMRSGVGPRNVLQPAGIPLIKDLPVGENLQDHPIVPFYTVLNNKSQAFDPTTDLNPRTWNQFLKYGEGPYTNVAGISGATFLSSSRAVRDGQPKWADIQFTVCATTWRGEQFKNNYLAPWETSIYTYMQLGRERSRGTVKLNPADPNGEPIIDLKGLSDPTDVEVLLDAIKAALWIFRGTETYKRLGARLFREPLPACSHLSFSSDDYWRCYIRQTTIPGNHYVGTCAMNTVVDSKLKVLEMNRLRVVDGSVMPFITNANVQAAILGIAEKGSATILKDNAGSDGLSLSVGKVEELHWNEFHLGRGLGKWI